VERQLASVEGQQAELEAWLDRYEEEVETLYANSGMGDAQGPDQERQRTYETAEKVGQRLASLGAGLGEMIGEINSASAALMKTSKADDPVCSFPLSPLQSSFRFCRTLTNVLGTVVTDRPCSQRPPCAAPVDRPECPGVTEQGRRCAEAQSERERRVRRGERCGRRLLPFVHGQKMRGWVGYNMRMVDGDIWEGVSCCLLTSKVLIIHGH
jgi:hypothetical protein